MSEDAHTTVSRFLEDPESEQRTLDSCLIEKVKEESAEAGNKGVSRSCRPRLAKIRWLIN